MSDLGHPLRLYAHRGSSARLPENTLEAFAQAVADGATALETDVHRTRDGHWVVCHDPDGRRMTGRRERIADCTLAEVTAWDAGAGFVDRAGDRPFAGRGLTIPTMAELLAAFPDVPVSVDLKPSDPRAVPSLLEQIVASGAQERAVLGSFHERVLREIRRLGWPGATALGRLEVAALRLLPLSLARRFVHGSAAQIPRRGLGLRLDSPGFIRRCRRLGLRVDYWTVNRPEVARELLTRGATGIMSDDPARIAPLFE